MSVSSVVYADGGVGLRKLQYGVPLDLSIHEIIAAELRLLPILRL